MGRLLRRMLGSLGTSGKELAKIAKTDPTVPLAKYFLPESVSNELQM